MKIIIDTREQLPWSFGEFDTVSRKLDTGDYSIEGLEEVLCIERKKSTAEIAINLGKDCKRFNKELERMLQFKYAYIICEFTLTNLASFPHNCSIPKYQLSKIRINAKYLIKRMKEIEEMGINVIYCNNKFEAEDRAIEIFNLVSGEING
jgi:hypothetical protein